MNTTANTLDVAKIINRVKLVITSPATCWDTIETESSSPKELTLNYIAPLAALGALCSFVGLQVFGISVPMFGTFRPSLFSNLIQHVVTAIMQVGGVYLMAAVVQKLAPSFGGSGDYNRSFSLVAHTMIPALLVGVLGLVPLLQILGLVFGLLGLYLFYTGASKMMGVTEDKRLVFVVVSIVTMAVVYGVILALAGIFASGPGFPTPSS